MDYDASESPDPDTWLDADEQQRIAAVQEYHDGLDDHPSAGSMQAHCMMHAVVETQIATGDPPETARKLETLLEAGIDRHAAIHALILPVAHVVYGVAEGDESGDTQELMGEKIADVTVEDAREQERTWE